MEGRAEDQQFRSLDVQSLQPAGVIPLPTGVHPLKPVPPPPSYDEAVGTGHVVREEYLSTVYSPRHGPLIYPCDHSPAQVCFNCIESVPRRRQDGRVLRVRRVCHTWPFKPEQPVWLKIAFFLITFSFFLVVFAIIYQLLFVEAFVWYGNQMPSSTPATWQYNSY